MDLLPLYASGEASEETCELVQEYIREHPEVGKVLQQIAEGDEMLRTKPLAPVPDLERAQVKSFKKARMLIHCRSGIMGAAIAFTLLPFAFVYEEGHFRWLVLSAPPGVTSSSIMMAVALWVAYLIMSTMARKIGL